MNIQMNFEDILKDAKNVYAVLRTEKNCPSDDMLPDYVYGGLSETEYGQMQSHVKKCERCRVEVLRLEADRRAWENALESDPDAALSHILGKKGIRALKISEGAGIPVFVSEIKEHLISWISPLWEPVWAGETVTAADIPEQEQNFEMDQGEYIHLSCYWQGKEGELDSFIRLTWNANIITYSTLWARFCDPKTMNILAEFCLGTDLSGEKVLYCDELGFDPSSQKWAVSVIVEAAE